MVGDGCFQGNHDAGEISCFDIVFFGCFSKFTISETLKKMYQRIHCNEHTHIHVYNYRKSFYRGRAIGKDIGPFYKAQSH